MQYHIPSDEQVEKAVRKVFKNYRIVTSQRKLKTLVEKELRTKKKQFHVSPLRLRRLALETGLLRLVIHSRNGDPHKVLGRCPVCNNPLQRVKNQTIYGGEVTLEYRCAHCGYWTGKKKQVPTLYEFHIK